MKPNMVFIVSDTLRRDYLGCYGNQMVHTPNLDRLGSMSQVFERHYAASFPTMPARADFFLGKWTFPRFGWEPLPPDERVLAELLSDAGYRTLGVADTPFFDRRGYNYDRGFYEFIRVPGQDFNERPRLTSLRRYETDYCAPATMTQAEQILEHYHKEPFFLYVDTWDPHEPWNPPRWYVEAYYPEYDGQALVFPCYARFQEHGLDEEDMRLARACYAGEITMVDRWTGRLIERLESLRLLDRTVIIFTTDHGFYLGEHNGLFGKLVADEAAWGGRIDGKHDATKRNQWLRSPLYEEIVHVPLMIYVPGREPRRISGLTSAIDMMPTILQLAGVEPPETVEGRGIVSAWEDAAWQGRDFVVSSLPLYNPGEITHVVDAYERDIVEYQPATITTDTWSLLYSAEEEPAELYDLTVDPQQQRNCIENNREVAVRLHRDYVSLLKEANISEGYLSPRSKL